MAKIQFKPSGVSIEVRDGTTVFAAALAAEVAIPSQCGGRCACALCRVRIVEGAQCISPMEWDESEHMGNCFHLTTERLSCQSRVYGDVVVQIDAVAPSSRPRSRYIPAAVSRKREKMEAEEELRRVRDVSRSGGSRSTRAAPGKEVSRAAPGEEVSRAVSGKEVSRAAPGKGATASKSASRRKRSSSRKRRGRNPGALTPGSTRPPPGAKGTKSD